MREIRVKSVLNRHKKRDPWFLDDYSVNPYAGCSFNCLYCYIRGSKYGKDMGASLSVKVNAPEVLEKQLKRRAERGEYGIIALATSTEPYQKIEEKTKLTRRLLEVILKYRFPVHLLTKSPLALRDMDLLRKIDREALLPQDLRERPGRGVIINYSFSTLNPALARKLEPGAPPPEARLEAMEEFSKAGFLAGVSLIPALPFLSDSQEEMERLVEETKRHGAKFLFAGALTLFGNSPYHSKSLYYEFLREHYPDLLPRYKSLFRIFPQPPKEYQRKLQILAERLCKKYGLTPGLV